MTIAEDSFISLTTEDIDKLGLGSYQIFTIDRSNDDIETFTVYQSDCDNVTILDNSTIPLSVLSI